MNPTIALVTVSFNSGSDLTSHWANAASLGVEWIVADNASTDDSAQIAEQLGARVVKLDRNRGFSAANNAAVETTDAECLIFLNPDVRVDDDGIKTLSRIAMERNAIVAPQLLNPDGTPQENGRTLPYLYRKFLHFFGHASSGSSYEIVAKPGELVEIDWAIGAALAMPATLFNHIKGWDASFFIYYEDSDICIRAGRAGYPVLLAGDVRWLHSWARATRRTFRLRPWLHEFSSAFRFYTRYPSLLLHPKVTRRYRGRGCL